MTEVAENLHHKLKFLLYAGGIFFLYFYYGILQETITRTRYGEEKEKFTYSLALVFFQCIVNAFYAKIMVRFVLNQGEDTTRRVYYASCSLTYLLAMVSSNMALQWVSYPTQLLSLTMDGLTGAVQERMITESKTKSGHMMLNMNLFSIAYLAIALLVTGELFTFASFVQRFPEVISKMVVFSICSALGQFFIFLMVSEFGPLPCSIVTTTRKFFTVLGSVLFFGNVLSDRQWGGTALVFAGLTLDAVYGKAPKKELTEVKASKE